MSYAQLAILDLLIVAVVVYFLFKGFSRGFAKELMGTGSIIISLVLAIKFMSDVSFAGVSPAIRLTFAFLLIFVAAIFILRWITNGLLKVLGIKVILDWMDKFGGALFGVLKGAIIVSLILNLFSLTSLSVIFKKQTRQSDLYDPMRRVAPLAYDAFKLILPGSKSFYEELAEGFGGTSRLDRRSRDALNFHRPKRKGR